jgi:NADH:ubiquinone oxidoreductase subunit E
MLNSVLLILQVSDGEQEESMVAQSVEKLIRDKKYTSHHLIEILLDIQESRGHLPEQDLRDVSCALRVPLLDVYRVASFYKALSLRPRGRHTVTVCAGTACHVRGAPRLVDDLSAQLDIAPGETTPDGMFTLQCVNCLGACAIGPVVVIDGVYHEHMTPGKVRKLIRSIHEAEGQVSHD